MPMRRSRLTKSEEAQYRSSLSYLKQIGIGIGSVEDHSLLGSENFTLEQIDHGFARVHDLEGGEVAVVIPAKLIVRKSGFMITEAQLIPSWFDWKLDLDNVDTSHPIIKEIVQDLPIFPPRILNHEFVGRTVPLRPCQIQGVIIGTGHSPIPARFHDETIVTLDLELLDECRNVFSYKFSARVDRSVMRARKRVREFYAPVESTKSSGLFEKVSLTLKSNFPRRFQRNRPSAIDKVFDPPRGAAPDGGSAKPLTQCESCY